MTARDALADAQSRVNEIDVAEAQQRQQQGALLLDVREECERLAGFPTGSLGTPRSGLELSIRDQVNDPQAELLLMCAAGQRSLLAARDLIAMGYRNVSSVVGGYSAWKSMGMPCTTPLQAEAEYLDRYSRHIRLPEVGLQGQARLVGAKVLLVGAGGLGSPVGMYLAAAGVGHIRVVDDDRVERSNLQRQVLHADARIGMHKVTSARIGLQSLNPRVRVESVMQRLDRSNVDGLVRDVDVVVDGADNFATRYVLSDACVRHAKPLVYGAVQRFEGQVSVFDAGRQRGTAPCYRCLFPQAPSPQDAPSCAEAGVLGVLPGLVGLMQATEVIKLILGIGETLTGRLLHIDSLAMRFRESRLLPDPQCSVCRVDGAADVLPSNGAEVASIEADSAVCGSVSGCASKAC